ncbi:MAG: hypothetical protein MUE33_04300 [Cytophagaceae bacterium]|nr:hypothetical protein [Cytophagaceae bacterium]
MIKTFTKNDVLRYVYGDVSPKEADALQHLLIHSKKFYRIYCQYASVKLNIKKVEMEPSDKSIETILNYSKSFSLRN